MQAGPLQWCQDPHNRREIELNPRYKKDKCGFIANKQSEELGDAEVLRGDVKGRGFVLNRLNRALDQGRPG